VSESRPPAFLDTSYIVRYLTDDPPEMALQASQVIDSEEPLVLSEMVLLETAYVLTSVYKAPRAELVDTLMELVQRANLEMANLPKAHVLEALRVCRDSKRHSFTDAMVWAQARGSGAERVYSFDKDFPSHGLEVVGFPRP
jgi:predicted nucleic-acid-binding protein